jgi:bifunctional DNase/RNase
MGAQLRRVQITRVEKSTYYAELHVQRGTELVQIDARPSDSIAVALRLSAPIYAAESLLVEPGDDTEEGDEEGGADEPDLGIDADTRAEAELSAEQLKAYLENLRPEDFGKFNP